ncbi:MAG: hypothetical protein IZT60_03155 [Gammaproteobacteria bacterium]|nr:hypothetical protein [Gammaproteobacteria bacterium]
MKIPFSNLPGRHERHFLRKLDNPLFDEPIIDYSDDDLLEVQRLDNDELLSYLTDLRTLVQQAIALNPNEESQVILDLKSDLDESYEKACTLADDQRSNKQAISQLLEVIMKTVRSSAGNDTLAQQQLEDEVLARATHFRLLEHTIVADMLDPDTRIQPQELAASLLSESGEGLAAALEIFDAQQLERTIADARQLLGSMDQPPQEAQARFQQIEDCLAGIE